MTCSNNITPCGCGNNPCGCGTSSDDVVYQGPNLSCTGVTNCDTVTEAIETIDGFICGPGMVENIINNILNNTNLYNQFTTIVNNTVDCQTVWNCYNSSTTTSTTTLCPCTYYEYVSVAPFPGTFTYVECDTHEVVTVTGGGEVDTVCVDNNYPTIEIGKINVLNTGLCCTFITTTTTTTLFIQSFCNQVTAIGTVYIYWTTGGGDPQVMKIKDETVYICAQVGSIAFTGTGSISVVGSATICESDGECAPTTTTTTTEALPCTSYLLEASGPSVFPGDTDWEAIECKTNMSVGGTVVYPNVVSTGCIITGSLLLGPKVIIVDSEPCPTTTTTTTLFPPPSTTTTTTLFPPSTTTTTTTIALCAEWTWEAAGTNVSDLEYTDCEGLPVVIPAIDITNNSGIICVYPNVTPNWDPSPTTGYHNISTFGINCPTTTTTTTTEGPITIYTYATACNSYTWDVTGDTYFDSDEISDTVGNVTNILYLTICPVPGTQTETQTVTAVSPYIWPINGQTYTASGSFSYTLPCGDGEGCIYFLELTIIEPTTTTTTTI